VKAFFFEADSIGAQGYSQTTLEMAIEILLKKSDLLGSEETVVVLDEEYFDPMMEKFLDAHRTHKRMPLKRLDS